MAVAAGTREGSRAHPFALLGDERLARLAAAGHERAFTVVYKRYHQPLYRFCRSILRDDADAQDALQSTFASAFAALARGQRDAPIRPWLFRIAHNEAISVVRRRRPTADLSAASGAWTASTEERAAERAELRTLLHDLDRLTERQRSALVMRELSGLSHEDIATALGMTVGTAKQTIYEARRSMSEFADGRAMPCDEIRRTISDADGRALRGRRVRAHLRECSGCAEFAAAIPTRTADLRALTPAMPAAAAAGLLQHIVGVGSGHAAGSAVSGLATVAAGKTATAALSANALAGAAVLAGATVGVSVGVGALVHGSHHGRPLPSVGRLSHVAPAARPRVSSVPAVHPRPEAVPARRVARSAPAARPSIRSTVSRGSSSAALGARSLSRLTTRVGVSTSTTTPAPAPVSRSATGSETATSIVRGKSANAPGHNKTSSTTHATSPGNSANAPGHTKASSATSPGNSANAPGHTKASSATSPGNSANAPGHTKTSSATPTTSPGNSANAPGHNPTGAQSPPTATTVASTTLVPTTPATGLIPPVTTTAPVGPPPNKHSK
jgi:RNA polymerase sigma factor (sigma-70 family)